MVPITPELIDTICAELATGSTMRSIARVLGVNDKSLARSLARDPVVMRRLHESRVLGTDFVMEQILDFGDPESETSQKLDPHRARVALDALKFYTVKMNPEKYGEKIDMNMRGRIDLTQVLLAADKRLQLAQAKTLRLPDITTSSTDDDSNSDA